MDQMYLSIPVVVECLDYMYDQLRYRQQQQQHDFHNSRSSSDSTTTTTVVSVHDIRHEWFPPVEATVVSGIPTTTTPSIHDDDDDPPPRQQPQQHSTAQVLVTETLPDAQFHWLLHVLCQCGCGEEEEDVVVLQRLDRPVEGSVYLLLGPNHHRHDDDNNVPLTLYDLQQSRAKIQTNIEAWRRRLAETTTMSNGAPRFARTLIVQDYQRKRLYEQHIDQAESTLLNLERIELSILHTIHVSRPTLSLLRQAKNVMQSLRCGNDDDDDNRVNVLWNNNNPNDNVTSEDPPDHVDVSLDAALAETEDEEMIQQLQTRLQQLMSNPATTTTTLQTTDPPPGRATTSTPSPNIPATLC